MARTDKRPTLDLDALRAARGEVESRGPLFTFRGERFDLPAECPWESIEGVTGASEDPTGPTRALKALLGTELEGPEPEKGAEDERTSQYQRFMALRPSQDDVKLFFEHVFPLYNVEPGEVQASGSP